MIQEVKSRGFLEIITVILFIHSLFKLAEVTWIFDKSRQMSLIMKNSITEMLKLVTFIFAVNCAFGAINQVLNPGEVDLYTSVQQVFENSFSFDFIDENENSDQVRNFMYIVRVCQ